MAHYAFLNDNNIVTEVIVGKDEDDNADLPEGFDSWEAWYACLLYTSPSPRDRG